MKINGRWYEKGPHMPEQTSAGGAVVRLLEGRLVVALIREGGRSAYVLPKGRVEPGESFEDAARREISEEAGLQNLLLLGELGVRERLNYRRTAWKRAHYFLFLADSPEELRAGVVWAPLDALPLMFWPEQRELLDSMRDEIARRVERQTKWSVRKQFSRRASGYARSPSHRYDVDLDLLIAYLQAIPADRVLDVATGTGFTALALRRHARIVVGVDLTPRMLQEARRLAPADDGPRWVVGDAEALPFGDGVFNQVTCRRAAHHFFHLERGVDEMLRVLAPGGHLGIIDQVPPEIGSGHELMEALEVSRDPSHARALRASQWKTLLVQRRVGLAFMQTVDRRQIIDEWLDLAGADETHRRAVATLLQHASPDALNAIGYAETPRPSFLKRWVVLVGRK